jgi:hypothetical protein
VEELKRHSLAGAEDLKPGRLLACRGRQGWLVGLAMLTAGRVGGIRSGLSTLLLR